MIDNIETGSQIQIKIVKQPSSSSATKTLQRVLNKDESAKAEQKRLQRARARNFSRHQRGGRQWAVRVVKQHPLKGAVGEQGTVKATYDVLKDLKSVERFIEVTPA